MTMTNYKLDFQIESYDAFIESRTAEGWIYMISRFGDVYHATFYDPEKHKTCGPVKICEDTLLHCMLYCEDHYTPWKIINDDE